MAYVKISEKFSEKGLRPILLLVWSIHCVKLCSLDPRPLCSREEGSGELLYSEVSHLNTTFFKSRKPCSQIFNVIGQLVLQCSTMYSLSVLVELK